MKPSQGRIVRFVSSSGEVYAAIVTRVWSDICVNLYAFPRGDALDAHDSGLRTSVVFDETANVAGLRPHSWHWPPREG